METPDLLARLRDAHYVLQHITAPCPKYDLRLTLKDIETLIAVLEQSQ